MRWVGENGRRKGGERTINCTCHYGFVNVWNSKYSLRHTEDLPGDITIFVKGFLSPQDGGLKI